MSQQITTEPAQDSSQPGNVTSPKPTTAKAKLRHPKFCFDNTLIAIEIEDTLFNVHKYQLMKSTTFSDMFAIAEESEDDKTVQEGSSLDRPIVMQGVSAADFECLMTVLYASHFSAHQPEPEAALIIPAFRLANMWNFVELCTYLRPLAERVLGDVDKIIFAREFGVAEWLAPAYAKLCLREEKITTEEARKLGVDSLLFITRFREEHPKEVTGSAHCSSCNTTGCYNCGGDMKVTGNTPGEEDVKVTAQKWLDGGCVL
ncbi:hypothetical protein FRC12_006370 [Ceratobasidium sp. 428]|nr:hypothetical protein FRC12_006370 [Ceratobasidium sp. 428]